MTHNTMDTNYAVPARRTLALQIDRCLHYKWRKHLAISEWSVQPLVVHAAWCFGQWGITLAPIGSNCCLPLKPERAQLRCQSHEHFVSSMRYLDRPVFDHRSADSLISQRPPAFVLSVRKEAAVNHEKIIQRRYHWYYWDMRNQYNTSPMNTECYCKLRHIHTHCQFSQTAINSRC